MIRVFIADDHPIMREGLKLILSTAPDIVLAGEVDNGFDVLKKARTEKWDLLLLDLTLPGKQGMDILKELRVLRPDLPVLILSAHPESQYAVRVLRAGAAGYLNKDCIPDMLIRAIRKVTRGGKFVSETVGEHLSQYLHGKQEKEPHENLSDREFEIFMLLISGTSVTEIANKLSVSIKTISSHRGNILQKMGMTSTLDMIRYAINAKLIEP